VDQCDPFFFGFPGFNFRQPVGRAAPFQLLHDGPKTIGRLRMSGAHIVFEIGRVVYNAGVPHALNRSTQDSA